MAITRLTNLVIGLCALVVVLLLIICFGLPEFLTQKKADFQKGKTLTVDKLPEPPLWQAPDTSILINDPNASQLLYGRRLISHTAEYFGPHGSIAKITNGMNCQNCHLDAGTRPFGNNYALVASGYPKFRARSGKIESVYKRVADCFERSLNGIAPDSSSKEINSIIAYINWVGQNVQKGEIQNGAGLKDLPYLERAADTMKGKMVYIQRCATCHLANGGGQMMDNNVCYKYPPLWGNHSFNTAAGFYRISKMAAYVKYNMPFGATYNYTQLSDEEAWDVSAYINSKPRPLKNKVNDWPDLRTKPLDYPFGPYTDGFSEAEHKYGPYGPIAMAKQK